MKTKGKRNKKILKILVDGVFNDTPLLSWLKGRLGKNVSNGKPIIENERYRFLELGEKRILRVNLIANVIDKFERQGEKKYLSLTVDDASAPTGFFVSTSSTTILAFSLSGATIPAGEGILTQVSFSNFDGEDICLLQLILLYRLF